MITQDRLQELLSYDPDSGEFRWKRSRRGYKGCAKAGSIAGRPKRNGYIYIGIDGGRYLAHRLAWLYVYGETPKEIDHINRVRSDNRISNLRPCNRAQNNANSDGRSGMRNIRTDDRFGRRRYRVFMNRKHVGTFLDLNEAIAARNARARELWGGYSRPVEESP